MVTELSRSTAVILNVGMTSADLDAEATWVLKIIIKISTEIKVNFFLMSNLRWRTDGFLSFAYNLIQLYRKNV